MRNVMKFIKTELKKEENEIIKLYLLFLLCYVLPAGLFVTHKVVMSNAH